MKAKATPLELDDDFYPSADGKPMAESDVHLDEMIYLITALENRYREASDIYVSGNLLLYYVQGDRRAVIAPDVFVVKGILKGNRKRFLLWKEGRGPCFIIEVTSRKTRREDEKKRSRYEQLGVEEYFLHDPLGEYLDPPLQGYRLQDGRYRPMAAEPDGTFVSRTTGLRLRREGEHLRLVELGTGRSLPSFEDLQEECHRQHDELLRQARELRRRDEKLREQDEKLRQSEAARRAAEEELARLRRELESRQK